jgi:predicted GNAT family N-acyltransferase
MTVVLLDKSHDRSDFLCEEESLTEYLQKQVSQDINKGLVTCFVVADDQQKVIGYYTLTSESLGRDTIPEAYQKKIPKNYNAPVILIGRLARHSSQRGTGLGEYLLMDALFRSYQLSKQSIGAMAVVVDPINEAAEKFYRKYGFFRLPDSGKMFMPMSIISKLV